jgi:hypothetical protein
MIDKKLLYIGLGLSLLLNLIFIGFFGKTIYAESRKIGKEIISDDIAKQDSSDFIYYDGLKFNIEGKFNNEENFYRLPAKYKDIVRQEVWTISQHSSGISVRFKTNSPDISVQWDLVNFRASSNMNRICSSGLDLYCLRNDKWQYVSSGIPTSIETEQLLVSAMDTTEKDFLLYLPLYDGIENLRIGIKDGFSISTTINNYEILKPIVFYGTSITQGGSASRPGLAYPSILSRSMNVETINLGFSGNGFFEESIGLALCEIDAEMYVIDCTPNSSPEVIKNNALELIKQIRNNKPNTPILLVESIIREDAYFPETDITVFGSLKYILAQNEELKKVYDKAIDLNLGQIYYLTSDGLIGYDHEGTVDGTHLNDLGMKRIAENIEKKIRDIYNER